MRKKGFTLIELLAVIVVLAIIALIATPMVLNIIDSAKKGAAEASANTYLKAIETYIVRAELDSSKPKLQAGVEYQLSSTNYEVASLADPETTFINDLVEVKGDKPESGYVIINEDRTVEKIEMIMNSYPVMCTESKCEVVGEQQKEEVYVEEPILNKAKALVYDENETCKTDGSTYNYMGGCYIKGASSNNYIWYNGFMWRIMGINSDGTIRLITDGIVTSFFHGPESVISYSSTEGYINDWLNEYFYSNLNATKSIIQEGSYFCSEATTENDMTHTEEILKLRTTCTSGNEITAKVGILSVDEHLLSINTDSINTDSYLDNTSGSYTMTPSPNFMWAFSFKEVGNAASNGSGIRPVINVASATIITSGNGTISDFYVLKEDKNTNIKGTISEKATSGEYVILEGHTYRVVNKGNDGVKLILDGYYEESEQNQENAYNMEFGENNIFTLESGIGQKLNSDVLTWLGLSTSDKIITTTYYQGDGFGVGSPVNYNEALKKSNGVEAKVGLIQVGDIMAGISSTMLKKTDLVSSYWSMSKGSNAAIWTIHYNGNLDDNDVIASPAAIRPVIVVRNDLSIISGTGTWKNPYKI